MARLSIQDFNNELGLQHSYDIINMIRNSSSSLFQQYVPLANAHNIAQVGQGLLLNKTIQNEFIVNLVDRIGLFVLQQKTLTNILAPFKKGALELGSRIEETYIDIVKAHVYDPDDAEHTVFKREIPDVKTMFHEVNRKDFYKQTIQDASLKQAFISYSNFDSFVAGIIQAMYNSNQVDEFKYMKLLLDAYYANGQFTVISTPQLNTQANLSAFVEKAREVYTLMTLPTGTREFNALNVHTTTLPDDFYIIMDAKLRASVDVNVLASAFNLDKADFLGRVITIDNFASTGLRAVAVDAGFFMVYDTLFSMETIRNPQGLYWNYNLHVWQVMSASRFNNAVAFIENAGNGINNLIVSPNLSQMRQGQGQLLDAVVRGYGTIPAYTLSATITGVGGLNPTVSYVTVNGNQIDVQVGQGESNPQLNIEVTATYDTDKTITGKATILVSNPLINPVPGP